MLRCLKREGAPARAPLVAFSTAPRGYRFSASFSNSLA
jgi:hypothetical protein